MDETLDYYQVLQVDRRADQKVIERVYRTLMFDLKSHPDLGGDEKRAQLINVAYQTLRDPERRRVYDEQLARRAARETAAPDGLGVYWRAGDEPLPPELEPPGVAYRSRCPRCRAEMLVPHSFDFDEHLQCTQCLWFFRDPHRELAALRARILRLAPASRLLATRLYASAAARQSAAEEAAARGDEAAAREALHGKRKIIEMLADELRWVRL